MRVLGLDPGSHNLGWGIVEVCGNRFIHVASGTLVAPAGELVDRLCYLGEALEKQLHTHAPTVAAVENIFHARNSYSALILGHARGAVLYCLGRCGIPVFAYTPGQIKQANTGRGAAPKEQVRTMVCMVLGLRVQMGLDTSDALAAALCHAQHAGRLDKRPQAVSAGSPRRSRRPTP